MADGRGFTVLAQWIINYLSITYNSVTVDWLSLIDGKGKIHSRILLFLFLGPFLVFNGIFFSGEVMSHLVYFQHLKQSFILDAKIFDYLKLLQYMSDGFWWIWLILKQQFNNNTGRNTSWRRKRHTGTGVNRPECNTATQC